MPARRSFKPLRGAVVGYGFISSKGHVPAYLDRLRSRGDVEIVAVADICSARRAQARKDLRGVQVFSDCDALLDGIGDERDFVDISTPPPDHARSPPPPPGAALP